jgi:hypothetical protein
VIVWLQCIVGWSRSVEVPVSGPGWRVIASALKSALSTAETAVTNLANGSGSVSGTVTAIAGAATAASSLFSKAAADCPS